MNRSLDEIKRDKELFQDLLNEADSISECLTYKGKLDLLEQEEKELLERSGVEI